MKRIKRERPASLGILEFNLDEPDGQEAHARALKSLDLCLLLWDLQYEVFRKAMKYGQIEGIENPTEEQLKAVEAIADRFHTMMLDRDINLDELMS